MNKDFPCLHYLENRIIPINIRPEIYSNNVHMENIFDTLVKNNVFLSHNKFQLHKDHSLGFFVEINLRVTLPETLRRRIHNQLMWIDLDDEDSQEIIHQNLDSDRNLTGKERIIIL